MIHAGSVGVTLNLIATPPETRKEGASAAIREAILSTIISDAEKTEKVTRSSSLDEQLR
jgi:hypothetical protein